MWGGWRQRAKEALLALKSGTINLGGWGAVCVWGGWRQRAKEALLKQQLRLSLKTLPAPK